MTNEYAVMAQEHWARFLPSRYQAIPDPDSFFSTLGQEVEDEIDQLSQQLAGDDPPLGQEGYLGKVGRLNAARAQAREKVLAERVLLPPEPGSERDETPLDEQDTEQTQTQPNQGGGWIPIVEDPTHPFWIEQRESGNLP